MNTNCAFALIAIGKCSQFDKVKQAIDEYTAEIKSCAHSGSLSPIIIKFHFEYTELLQMCNEFLQLLLNEPVQCLEQLRNAVWYHFDANFKHNPEYEKMCKENRQIRHQQIHCSIHFDGLPLTEEEFIFRPFVHPVRLGVTTMHCVLSGLGECGTYVKQSIWYCPSKCRDNECRLIGYCPFDWTQNIECQKCLVCMNNMKEHTDYRKVADYRRIKVHLIENVTQTPQHLDRRIKRGVIVELVDDSCDIELQLGDEYILVGNYNPMANRFIAWNIAPCE